ncbi:hypothetical protein EMCRGX_G026321 [Ephydatia muelleri]
MEAWNILHSDCAQTALELVKYQHIICQLFAPDGSNLEFKQAHHHTSRHYSTIWCIWSEPPTIQARRFASVSTLAGATRGQSAILPTGAGSQAVVESTPPRPGHVLHQWPHDLHKLTPLCDQRAHTTLRPASSHHSTNNELTPLYDQRSHTTLRPASSHHSTTSELTSLYDKRAHTTLRPVNSHHSYNKRAHTTLRPASSHHSTTSKHTTLQTASSRPVSSHHSTTSKLTSLYDQQAHHSTNSELTTSELTPLYEQRAHTTLRPASSHHTMTSELTSLYDQRVHITLQPVEFTPL